MAFHALADYHNHVIGWLQWEQSPLGDGAVVRFPRIWMSSGECRLRPSNDFSVRLASITASWMVLISPVLTDLGLRTSSATLGGSEIWRTTICSFERCAFCASGRANDCCVGRVDVEDLMTGTVCGFLAFISNKPKGTTIPAANDTLHNRNISRNFMPSPWAPETLYSSTYSGYFTQFFREFMLPLKLT